MSSFCASTSETHSPKQAILFSHLKRMKNESFLIQWDINVSGMTFTTPPCFIAVVANPKLSLVAQYIVQELIGVLFSHSWLFSLRKCRF